MEAIATGLAVEAAKAITKVVAGSAFEEIKLVRGFKDQLHKLKEKFLDIEALMNDLGNAKHAEKSQLVNRWLQKLKDVAYSADDLIDDYAYEMLRRKIELKTTRPSFKKKCRNFFARSTNPVFFRFRIVDRINQILSELDDLDKQAQNIGLEQVKLAEKAVPVASSSGGHTDPRDSLYQARKHAAARGSQFIGREHDKEKLLQILLNPTAKEDGLSVLAIVGIGGLGKTTLAHQLYEHEKVDGHFNKIKVWICVSEDFSVDKLLKEMVESLTSNKCDLTNTGAIITELEKALKGKKFFLVLDDVWNENKQLWDSLKIELRRISDLNGSVILITTRSPGITKKACASYSHKLEGLSEDDGWALLKQQVFDETMLSDSSYDDVGRRIVKNCKGVPLALKAIGGLLQAEQNASNWEVIERSEIWNIQPDDNNNIMPSLLLSYNHINDVYVKQCFAYCAIIPKDSVMEKGQVIALWLAQGLIHSEFETGNSSATQEISGEKCFDILVNYSFLQKENNDYHAGYKMHDLVHDLATYVSKRELLVWKPGVKIDVVDSQVRHLVFNLKDHEIAPETLAKEKMRKLRTIIFWHGMPKWNSLTCARYMRTLVMAAVGLIEVPSVIGQLVHLRYLDLSKNCNIKALPESICKLYQLQTLRLWDCFDLRELPRELHKLENVRHIETSFPMYASRGLRKLTCLQTLSRLWLRDGKGWTIDELGPLDQVKGDVCIGGLESLKNKEEAREAGLGRKDKILKLELSWGYRSSSEGHNDEVVLDNLEPHPNIQSLVIENFSGAKFPRWIMTMNVEQSGRQTQLSHLTEVNLNVCYWCQQLPSLGQLPKLAILRLFGFAVERIGDEFYGNSSNISERKVLFPALRELYIKLFRRLTTWMPPSSALATSCFPNLETLDMIDCKRLETVPRISLKSLKRVQLRGVGGNQTLDKIKGSPGLNSLIVKYMDEIMSLPEELSNCRNLQTLEIRSCEKVKCIPSGMLSLKELRVTKCPSLGSIEEGVLQGLSSLRVLYITGCRGLKRMPKSLEDCTSLELLYIIEEEEPIPDIGKLQGLTRLKLVDAGGLMAYLPRWIPQLHRLNKLWIGGWGEEWDMSLTSALSSLRELSLWNFPNLKPLVPQPEQPLEQLLPPSLQSLTIWNFEGMEVLPDWIGYLSSLQFFYLFNCNKLKYLPSKEAMLRLSRLRILEICCCRQLEERCDKDNGPEWPKISHLPGIMINLKNVQDHR